jgi:hypothetical protein
MKWPQSWTTTPVDRSQRLFRLAAAASSLGATAADRQHGHLQAKAAGEEGAAVGAVAPMLR